MSLHILDGGEQINKNSSNLDLHRCSYAHHPGFTWRNNKVDRLRIINNRVEANYGRTAADGRKPVAAGI